MLREHSFPAAGRILVLPVGAPFSSLGSDSFWDAGKERGDPSPADSGQPSGESALHVSKIAQMFWGERERAKVREKGEVVTPRLWQGAAPGSVLTDNSGLGFRGLCDVWYVVPKGMGGCLSVALLLLRRGNKSQGGGHSRLGSRV